MRLFEPLTVHDVTFRNRIWLAPMCMYSATDGLPNDFHLMHLGIRAAGGFGLVLTEATAVSPQGRISPWDTGIWEERQVQAWQRITDQIHAHGAVAGMQLGHAGRKASVYRPWDTQQGTVPAEDGGWETVAPSAIAFPGYAEPVELSEDGIKGVVRQFADAAVRANEAGFDLIQLHAAHGYLLHQFLSPLANQRTDSYGGSLANRARLLLEVIGAVRQVWPAGKVLAIRFSATDYLPQGLEVADVAQVARWAAEAGVDVADISSGGLLPAPLSVGPGYQVPAAREIKDASGLIVSAVGLITDPAQAEQVLVDGSADAVSIGRAALRDPMWPLRAGFELGVPASDLPWLSQYRLGTWSERRR